MKDKRFAGKMMACILTALLVLLCAVPALAEEAGNTNAPAVWQSFTEDVSADAACLIDANTGIVLYEKNMEQSMFPASVTKIMTTLLALENGNLSDQVAMTAEGTQYAVSGSSNLYTQVGEVFTLEQLLQIRERGIPTSRDLDLFKKVVHILPVSGCDKAPSTVCQII